MAEANISNAFNQLNLMDSESVAPILDLPTEVLVKIFAMLQQEDVLGNVAMVCKRFLEITRIPEVLPNVRIFSNYIEDIGFYARKIQNLHEIYPASTFDIDVYYAEYSDMEKLQNVSHLINNMSLRFGLDSNKEDSFPVFENLEFMDLRDVANPGRYGPIFHLYQVPGFWSNFPKLTYLNFDVWDIMYGMVSIQKKYIFLTTVSIIYISFLCFRQWPS